MGIAFTTKEPAHSKNLITSPKFYGPGDMPGPHFSQRKFMNVESDMDHEILPQVIILLAIQIAVFVNQRLIHADCAPG